MRSPRARPRTNFAFLSLLGIFLPLVVATGAPARAGGAFPGAALALQSSQRRRTSALCLNLRGGKGREDGGKKAAAYSAADFDKIQKEVANQVRTALVSVHPLAFWGWVGVSCLEAQSMLKHITRNVAALASFAHRKAFQMVKRGEMQGRSAELGPGQFREQEVGNMPILSEERELTLE